MSTCWLYDNCSRVDCDTFCLRKYKLATLYDLGLITEQQRKNIYLTLDDDSDIDSFNELNNIKLNIKDFVDKGTNLYIYSKNCGNGKTSWSLKLIQAYANRIWYESKLECQFLFINVPRFLLAIKDNISQHSDYVEHIKKYVYDCPLVVWDEIGTKGLTSYEHEHLLNIINARIDSGKCNIYTSNLTNIELNACVGERLYSRIVNFSKVIELKGKDKRKPI